MRKSGHIGFHCCGYMVKNMKLKWRVILLGCVIFILYVSFKILEPDIKQQTDDSDTVNVDVKEQLKGSNSGERGEQHYGAMRDAVIENLIDKFKLNFSLSLKDSPWKIAEKWVKAREIHPPSPPELGAVLQAMSTSRIIKADFGYRGTQLKLSLILEGGQIVAFKPKWYSRDHVIEGKPYDGADRHNGEIAAYHLGRILNLRRSPLIIGRKINLQTEIIPVATSGLLATFFNVGNNTCFYGKCYYCKSKEDGVCADMDMLEGAIVLWLPKSFKLKLYKHPWSRTYRKGKSAKWETDDNYCDIVKQIDIYRDGPRLLDIIDVAVFDYLIGNADRHHYETLGTANDSMMLILDNAKSFGNPYIDEKTILAPLYQCCSIRYSTWQNLLIVQNGILSSVLRATLNQDPIAPVLDEPHYKALDRRLRTVLSYVEMCAKTKNIQNVLITNR